MDETQKIADLQNRIDFLQYDLNFWKMLASEQMIQLEDAHAIIERNGCPEVCIIRERMLKERKADGTYILEEIEQEEIEAAQFAVVSKGPQNRVARGKDAPGVTEELMLDETLALERNYILAALQETGGNITQAAKLVGIPRTTLSLKIQKHKMRDTVSAVKIAAVMEGVTHGSGSIE